MIIDAGTRNHTQTDLVRLEHLWQRNLYDDHNYLHAAKIRVKRGNTGDSVEGLL